MIPDQVRALVYLKFTLLRNSWMRGKRLSLILGTIIALLLTMVAILMSVGLFALGISLPRGIAEAEGASTSLVLLVVSDALVLFFLFFWAASLLTELQRSEVIDVRKMLFLPVPLRLVFMLNFVVSLISIGSLFFVLPLTGFALGLAIGFGPRMLLVLPIAAAFYFMLAGWTYYVRGILVFIMENKRRRRTVIVFITLFFALLGQLPMVMNFTIMSHVRENNGVSFSGESIARAIYAANVIVPIGWLPSGVAALAGGTALAPTLAFLGLTGLGAGGLTMGYRSTLRHYTGTGRRKFLRLRRERGNVAPDRRPALMSRKLPLIDDDTAAVALASFLGYIRHPQIRMQLVMPVVVGAIMLVYFRWSEFGTEGGAYMRAFAPVGVAIWPILSMAQIIFNVFGIDAEGFRAFVLLPTDRRKYLIGKNLALLAITGGVAAFFVAICALLLSFSIAQFLQSLGYILMVYLLFCIVGNVTSIYAPFRIRYQGRQSFQSGGWVRVLAVLAIFPLGIVTAVLALIPAAVSLSLRYLVQGTPAWVSSGAGLMTAGLLLGVVALAYRFSVGVAGEHLAIREQRILEELVKDRE